MTQDLRLSRRAVAAFQAPFRAFSRMRELRRDCHGIKLVPFYPPLLRGDHMDVCIDSATWIFTAPQGLVAEVPSKFARVGGSRPDFGPEKSKKTHKNPHKTLIKSKLNQK